MPANSNTLVKVIGLILLVGGIGLAFWGYQLSGSFAAKLARGLNGALPEAVMVRYIGGAISSVVGLFLLIKR